jgi:hypothetical protein
MSHDLKIALLVGGLYFLLGFPQTVSLIILSQSIQDWWSTTTDKRLRKRLAVLEREFGHASGVVSVSDGEWLLFRTQSLFGTYAAFMFSTLFVVLAVTFLAFDKVLFPLSRHSFVYPVFVICEIGNVVSVWMGYCIGSRLFRYETRYTDAGRFKLAKQIERLRLKIQK